MFALLGVVLFSATTIYAQDSSVVKVRKTPVKEVKIWMNGQQLSADNVDVVCVEDDFSTYANLRYTISDSTGKVLASGFVKMTGDDYVDYITKPHHGQRALVYVMRELNLVSRPQAKK